MFSNPRIYRSFNGCSALGKTLLEPVKPIQKQQLKNGNCIDWSLTSLNDRVESFYYQDSSCASIQFFQDKQCSGISLGTSTGPWQNNVKRIWVAIFESPYLLL
jgi:hypothetical protein